MIKLKVRKFGNSLGVVLPKEVVNRLHTKDGGTSVPDRSTGWRLSDNVSRSHHKRETGKSRRYH